jgi:hypothetical protein
MPVLHRTEGPRHHVLLRQLRGLARLVRQLNQRAGLCLILRQLRVTRGQLLVIVVYFVRQVKQWRAVFSLHHRYVYDVLVRYQACLDRFLLLLRGLELRFE